MQSITAKLETANIIAKEIRNIESFLHVAERTWRGKLHQRFIKWKLFTKPYGSFGEVSIELDTETKNKMLEVLRDKKRELENELISILMGEDINI